MKMEAAEPSRTVYFR